MEKVAVYASLERQKRKSINDFFRRVAFWCLAKKYDYTIFLDRVPNHLNLKNREKLEELKKDITNKKYSKVVIENISHLSRNIFSNVDFLNFIESNNCEIESMDGLNLTTYKELFEGLDKHKEEKER